MIRSFKLALALAILLPLAASAGMPGSLTSTVPAAVLAKLSPRLATIAQSAEQGRGHTLMTRAISKQAQGIHSPLVARWNSAGQVQVYLHYGNHATPSLNSLRKLGATRIVNSPELRLVQAWVPANALYAAASLFEVNRITVPRYARSRRMRLPVGGPVTRTGSVDSEGDQILGAQQYRQLTGFTGTGISVGVISDGAGDIATDQSTGDLPSNPAPWVDPNMTGSGFEGTAMMEIVHDLAPGAQLGFCGPGTTADFIKCLNDFASNTANFTPNIIVDDLGFPGVAMFTNGGFATAVENFAKAHPNIQLVSAAGNDARQFWSGPWDPTPVNVTINGITYTKAQNFGSSSTPNINMSFRVAAGDTVTYLMQWDDTWVASNAITKTTPNDPNDYDVFLTDTTGKVLACNQGANFGSSASPPSPTSCPYTNTTTQPTDSPGPQPVQGNTWTNNGKSTVTVYLQIYYQAGSPGQNLKVLVSSSKYQLNLFPDMPAGSIYGQSALKYPYELTVGAISAANATAKNYQIESYSSRGPILFSQPSTGKQTYIKPDFVGVDCVKVTGVGGFANPFCGTSAAAPHIAALLALLQSGYPNLNDFDMLKDGATKIGTTVPNGVYGYGLPNVYQSALVDSPKPIASITAPAANTSITVGGSVSFQSSCSANGSPGTISSSWDFGTGSGIAASTSLNPTVTYSKTGTFTATLTCTNSKFNSTGSASRVITVAQAPSSGGGGGGGGSLGIWMLLLLAGLTLTQWIGNSERQAIKN